MSKPTPRGPAERGHGPVSQGSKAACAVLQALHTWGKPATRAEIRSITGLSDNDSREALRGVRERGLADVYGRSQQARWILTRWVTERRPDVMEFVVRQSANKGGLE